MIKPLSWNRISAPWTKLRCWVGVPPDVQGAEEFRLTAWLSREVSSYSDTTDRHQWGCSRHQFLHHSRDVGGGFCDLSVPVLFVWNAIALKVFSSVKHNSYLQNMIENINCFVSLFFTLKLTTAIQSWRNSSTLQNKDWDPLRLNAYFLFLI